METNMSHSTSSQSSPPLVRIVILVILGIGIGAFFYFDLGRYFSLEALKANRDSLRAYTNEHGVAAAAVFILIYVVQTGFSLPGATIMTLTGGFLFGSVLGTLFVNVGATTGATLAFLAARYVLRDWVEKKFGDRLETIQAGFAPNSGYSFTN